MKELYTSPELEVNCFAPVERLAAEGSIDLGELVGAATHAPSASLGNDDINVKL